MCIVVHSDGSDGVNIGNFAPSHVSVYLAILHLGCEVPEDVVSRRRDQVDVMQPQDLEEDKRVNDSGLVSIDLLEEIFQFVLQHILLHLLLDDLLSPR